MQIDSPAADQAQLRIRPAIPADAAAVAAVHVASWREAYRTILPAEYLARLSVERRQQVWRESIETGSPRLLVAEIADSLAGFSAFGPCRDEGAGPDAFEIWAIYLSPAHWSHGVGRALWFGSRARMIESGARTVSLWVFPDNARAIRFYRAAGFVEEPGSLKSFELGGTEVQEIRYVLHIAERSAASMT